ncbi:MULTISPECIES: exonuclease domain-containing protein [unclassified Bradyrhizobium]|uniref:exonuclease domain-containing protein n=1 Tax=unclassified Bradyrhizobium TaxID=2631580 RepID=UPI002FF05E92
MDITPADIFADRSAKMGRSYERETGRIENLVEQVKELKRHQRYADALALLNDEMDLQERDCAAGLGGVAPWYYEQAAIIYRKLDRFDDEIAVLKRYAAQPHAPGVKPPKLLQRLEMARWQALKQAGVNAPKPAFDDKPASKRKTPAIILDPNQEAITDFIALDVETANADSASICSIGLVHFRRGEIFKSLTILVDPRDEFDPMNISIHGITPEMVQGKPDMRTVFPVIAAALQDVVVVHHSHFDKTALTRAAEKYGTEPLPCIWLDTLRVARRAWPEFVEDGGGYGLKRLASTFGIEFRHHDAAEDARAAGLLLQRAQIDSDLGIVDWLRRVEQPIAEAAVAQSGNKTGPLAGEVVVFTGRLNITRSAAAALAAEAGCDVAESVTQRTTLLVVGDQDLRATKGYEKSSKQRKAEALISSGQSIRILGESDFERMARQP